MSPAPLVIIEVTHLAWKRDSASTLFDEETLFPLYIVTEAKQSQTKLSTFCFLIKPRITLRLATLSFRSIQFDLNTV